MTAETEVVVEVETGIENTENTENAEITETAIAPGEPITTEEQKAIEEVLKPSENKTDEIAFVRELWDLFDMIYERESECRQREKVVESLKEQLKYAKEQLDEATVELRELICESRYMRTGSQNDENRPLFNPPGAGNMESTEPTADWRSLSTEILLDPPIEGFGAKKRQALLDALPTLGAFEDLRGRVGRDAATLRELLPKGIGEQAADALEERLITAIQKHGITDSLVVEESPPVVETVVGRPEDDEVFQRIALDLYELAQSNRDAFNTSGEEHDPDIVAEGCVAYDADEQVDNCPYAIDSAKFLAWVHGWVSHYVDDPNQAEETEEAAEPELSGTKLTPQMLDDL